MMGRVDNNFNEESTASDGGYHSKHVNNPQSAGKEIQNWLNGIGQEKTTQIYYRMADEFRDIVIDDSDLSYMRSESPDDLDYGFVEALACYKHDYNEDSPYMYFVNFLLSTKYRFNPKTTFSYRAEDLDEKGKAIYNTLSNGDDHYGELYEDLLYDQAEQDDNNNDRNGYDESVKKRLSTIFEIKNIEAQRNGKKKVLNETKLFGMINKLESKRKLNEWGDENDSDYENDSSNYSEQGDYDDHEGSSSNYGANDREADNTDHMDEELSTEDPHFQIGSLRQKLNSHLDQVQRLFTYLDEKPSIEAVKGFVGSVLNGWEKEK